MANLSENDPLIIGRNPITVDPSSISITCFIVEKFPYPADISNTTEYRDENDNVKQYNVHGRAIQTTAVLIPKNTGTCRPAAKGDILSITHPEINGGSALSWVVTDVPQSEDGGAAGIRQTVQLTHFVGLDTTTVANGNAAMAE